MSGRASLNALAVLAASLAGHRIHHEQRFDRMQHAVDGGDLLHHALVDGQASGGIDDEHVVEAHLGIGQCSLGNRRRRFVGSAGNETRVHLAAQRLQLFDGRRAVYVGAHHRHALAFALFQEARQLGNGGGLASALQTRHQYHGRRVGSQIQGVVGGAHQLHQLVVNHLHEGLSGIQRRKHFAADGALLHVGGETAYHGQRHVRLQQRQTYLAYRVADILLGQTPAPGNGAQGVG